MANVATELHTHTQNHPCLPHLQTTAHMPHTGNVSSILSLPCSPLSLPLAVYTVHLHLYRHAEGERCSVSHRHALLTIYMCVCVCIGAELFTQTRHTHPVYEYGCSHSSIYTVHSLSLQIYRENTLISHTVLSIRLYTRTCAHRDLHAGTPLSLYTYTYIYSYARRAGHTHTISLSIHIHNESYIHTALYSYAL